MGEWTTAAVAERFTEAAEVSRRLPRVRAQGYFNLWPAFEREAWDLMGVRFDGHPNLQKLGKLEIGETVLEQLQSDLALEKRAIPVLNAGIELCREKSDNGTAELLEEILVDEEEHADWLEAQLTLVEQVGIQNYLAQQVKKEDE